MDESFKKVLFVLYKQFGDQGVAWAQQKVASYFDARSVNEQEGEESADAAGYAHSNFSETEGTSFDGDDSLYGDTLYDDVSYQDGDAFAAGVSQTMQNLAGGAIRSPDQVVDSVMTLVVMAGEVRKFEEAQVTKRVGIAADRDVALARIKAQQELLRDYLERSFDERAKSFGKFFDVIDNALGSGNMTALALGLESVVQLATSSPFKDLRSVEETAAALANPDHEWDF